MIWFSISYLLKSFLFLYTNFCLSFYFYFLYYRFLVKLFLNTISYYKIQPQGPLNVEDQLREQYNYAEDGNNLGHSCVALAVIPKGSTYDITMGNSNWLIVKDNSSSTPEYVAIEFDIGLINSITKINIKDL